MAVGDNTETEGYGSRAIEILPGKIVDEQSLGVDAVSGATKTSRAILAACRRADLRRPGSRSLRLCSRDRDRGGAFRL